MKKQFRFVPMVLLLLILCVFAWAILRPRESEPVFQGKPVSSWIRDLSRNPFTQTERLSLGQDCVPVLTQALGTRPGTLEEAYFKVWPKLPGAWKTRFPRPVDLASARLHASYGLMEEATSDSRFAAPALFRALDDEDEKVRINVLWFLGQMGTEKEMLPEILRAAKNRDALVRAYMIWLLQYHQEQANIVVPTLLKALRDSDADVRMNAVVSLNRIDSQVAAKAGGMAVALQCMKEKTMCIPLSAELSSGHIGKEPVLVVSGLIEVMAGTNIWCSVAAEIGRAH